MKDAKDPDRPKRALSAFFLYSQATRPQVKEENPEAPFGEIVSLFQKPRCMPFIVVNAFAVILEWGKLLL